MGKLIKILGYVIGTLVLIIVVAFGLIYGITSKRMNQKFELVGGPVPVPKDKASIAEGKRLFLSRGCADCHGMDLAGTVIIDDPAIGHFAGANLTTGNGGVGSSLSDQDMARSIRHAISKDGRPLIFMPATDFQFMSDEDVGLIISYVRSMPPVDKPAPVQKPGPLGRFLYLIGQSPLLITAEIIDHKKQAPAKVKPEVSVEYGRYISYTCTGCHGDNFSGGPIPGAPPDWPPAQNITPTGIQHYTEKDFITAVRTGMRPNGTMIKPPMPWKNLANMNDTELKALWMFMKTVPPKPFASK